MCLVSSRPIARDCARAPVSFGAPVRGAVAASLARPILVRPAGAAAAFTLVELLTVLALLAILSGSAFGLVRGVEDRAAIARAKSELAVLAQAVESWRSQYADLPVITDPADFYQALTGVRGPQNRLLDPPGRTFIEAAPFALRFSDPSAPGNVLLDPWGQPYHYVSFTRTSDGPGTPGFVVFSSGPDGRAKPDDPPAAGPGAGEPDLTAPDNADNLYSNR